MSRSAPKQKKRATPVPKAKAAPAAPVRAPDAPKAASAAERKLAMKAKSEVKPQKSEPASQVNSYPIGKGRKNKKQIAIYMHPLAKDTLEKISRAENLSVQELGIKALNLLFLHFGEKPIA